jgi:hypothetical protein
VTVAGPLAKSSPRRRAWRFLKAKGIGSRDRGGRGWRRNPLTDGFFFIEGSMPFLKCWVVFFLRVAGFQIFMKYVFF